jgi:hypothetical protein
MSENQTPKVQETPKKDAKIYALFQNVEHRGASLTYAWRETSGEPHKILTYEDGQVYLMSQAQIDHLNSLAIEVYKKEVMPDGQVRSVSVGKQHRFSVRPASQADIEKAKEVIKARKQKG